ncbi:glycosyl transferase [Pseudolabrys taiwanensis]|nr:glycosyl transferase [Pseudolabrys taiwanensis]
MSAALIVALRPILVRYALARPNARSSHKVPTPQGGGIAVIASVVLATSIFTLVAPGAPDPSLVVICIATIVLAVTGAADDIRPLTPLSRLIIQSAAVLAMLYALPADLHIVPALPWWLERAALFVGSLWLVNLTNFMDGIDWMTVAEVVPVAMALALFGFFGALPAAATLVALALCGAMLGFAPFNMPVARLFLGDVGSLPIGLLLAWLLILLAQDHLAAAILLPLYYAADATITLARRAATGAQLTQAHRDHFYQHALDGGMTVMAIVSRVFWLNVALALLAAATLVNTSLALHVGAIILGCVLVGLTLLRFERAKT